MVVVDVKMWVSIHAPNEGSDQKHAPSIKMSS